MLSMCLRTKLCFLLKPILTPVFLTSINGATIHLSSHSKTDKPFLFFILLIYHMQFNSILVNYASRIYFKRSTFYHLHYFHLSTNQCYISPGPLKNLQADFSTSTLASLQSILHTVVRILFKKFNLILSYSY